MAAPRDRPVPDAPAHPLWPLVLILGEIAARVERRRAEERTAVEGPGVRPPVAQDPTP